MKQQNVELLKRRAKENKKKNLILFLVGPLALGECSQTERQKEN